MPLLELPRQFARHALEAALWAIVPRRQPATPAQLDEDTSSAEPMTWAKIGFLAVRMYPSKW